MNSWIWQAFQIVKYLGWILVIWKGVRKRESDCMDIKLLGVQVTQITFAVRETASLGIMGAPRVPPLNPSESIVL